MRYPVHRANHGLPTSYGFSGSDELSVVCGRCGNESFAADSEWAAAYLDAKRRRVQHAVGAAYPYGMTQAEADGVVAEYRAMFVRAGLLEVTCEPA